MDSFVSLILGDGSPAAAALTPDLMIKLIGVVVLVEVIGIVMDFASRSSRF